MKITKDQLRQIVREEVRKATLSEAADPIKDRFGLKQTDYDSLLKGAKGFNPSPALMGKVKTRYPKLKDEEARVLLQLLNSKNRGTFDSYDVMSYLKKKGY